MNSFKTHATVGGEGTLLIEGLPFVPGSEVDITVAESPASALDEEPRIFGLGASGGYRMSDDFNDPLPDSFWLGEEAQ